MIVHLTAADQLVVRDVAPADAVELWHRLHALYSARRGTDRGGATAEPVPATIHPDAIDLVNAFENLAAPISLRVGMHDHRALWLAWRRAYDHVFQVVSAAPDHRVPFPNNRAFWLAMLHPFAQHLAAIARPSPVAQPR